jgi:hypothetical protein
MPNVSKAKLKNLIKEFRRGRETAKELDQEVKKQQPILVSHMRGILEDGVGLVFSSDEPDGKNEVYVIAPKGSEVWDHEAVLEYLRLEENKKKWMACSTRHIDYAKWEAEIAAGNIPAKVASKLKTTKPPGQPYLQFRKPGEDK